MVSKKNNNNDKPKQLTVVERIAKEISSRIRRGTYVPGQRLIEAELTKSLGVSRGPLREALWRLSGEGLVSIEANRGVSVKRLSKAEILDLYAIREMLEGLAARLAAKNIDRGNNLKRLKAAKQHAEKHGKETNIEGYALANEDFHDTIVALSGNKQLAELLVQLRLPLFRIQLRRIIKGPRELKGSIADHKIIYEAITSGNAERAERAMRRHVRNSAKLVKQDYEPDLN